MTDGNIETAVDSWLSNPAGHVRVVWPHLDVRPAGDGHVGVVLRDCGSNTNSAAAASFNEDISAYALWRYVDELHVLQSLGL